MKQLYLLLLPALGIAQNIATVTVKTNEIAFSTYSNKIYATIPSANGSNGNSVGAINPGTHLLENTYVMGSEPGIIAMSDNGQTLYVGFTGTSTVRKFDVTTHTASIQFPLGSDSSTGQYYADDIAVMPGNPNALAVARRNIGYSPRAEGVAIFDNGIMRPVTTPDHIGSNKIGFGSANTLVGYDNESSQYGFRTMNVDASGVVITTMTSSLTYGWNPELNFSTHGNKAYFNNGVVIDFNFSSFVSGTFANARGPAIYDVYNNLVCFASYDENNVITFKRYNPDTYLLFDSLPIPGVSGPAKSITVCGNGSYAFNTENKVVIINGLLSTENFELKNAFVLSPNPASDVLNIDFSEQVSLDEIAIVNNLGQVIRTEKAAAKNTFAVDVSMLPTGTYFARLNSVDGQVVKKFIKR